MTLHIQAKEGYTRLLDCWAQMFVGQVSESAFAGLGYFGDGAWREILGTVRLGKLLPLLAGWTDSKKRSSRMKVADLRRTLTSIARRQNKKPRA